MASNEAKSSENLDRQILTFDHSRSMSRGTRGHDCEGERRLVSDLAKYSHELRSCWPSDQEITSTPNDHEWERGEQFQRERECQERWCEAGDCVGGTVGVPVRGRIGTGDAWIGAPERRAGVSRPGI